MAGTQWLMTQFTGYSNGWCTDRKFCCHWLAVLHKLIKNKNLLRSQEWLQATTSRTNESNHQKQSVCTEEYYDCRLSSKHAFKNCLEKDKRELSFGQNVGEDLLRDHCAPFWTEAWSHPSFCWLNYLKIKTFTAEFQNHISKLELSLPFFSCLCHISTSLLSILQISTLISHRQLFLF